MDHWHNEWENFNEVKDRPGMSDREQIDYWKYAYWKTNQMLEDCADNMFEQADFYRATIKDLRQKLKEARDEREGVV